MPGAAQGPPSSIGYKGKVTANGQTIEGTVDAKVAARPSITADLRDDAARSRQAGRRRPAPPRRGVGRRPPRPPQPIDTSAMRAFDASFKLAPERWSAPPLRLSNADIAAHAEGRRAHAAAPQGRALWRHARSVGDRQRQQARARLRPQGRRQQHPSRRDAARPVGHQPVRRRDEGHDRRQAERHRHHAARRRHDAEQIKARWWAARSSAATSSSAPTRR